MPRAALKSPLTRLLLLLFVLLLAACNPSESSSDDDNGDDEDETQQEDDNGNGDEPPPVVLEIGTGQQDTFSAGEILVGDGSFGSLSPNGEVDLEVRLVDTNDNNSLILGQTYEVTFGSICADREPAAASFTRKTVEVTNGIATTRYIDRGCGNVRGGESDRIYAVVSGESVAAAADLEVLPSSVGAIEVAGISDQSIAYRAGVVLGGQPLPQYSEVSFRVVDSRGNAIPNRELDFRPASTKGGIRVEPEAAVTDDAGVARTTLFSGRVNSSVGVIAEHTDEDDVTFTTTSPAIAMHTGYPTQRGFTLSVETFNPNAWTREGVEVPITIRVSDRYGNVGPATEVAFSTKRGGRIEGSCTTDENGTCSVTWDSQPGAVNNNDDNPALIYITALTEGEGEFKDLNGDGLFDPDDDGDTDHGTGTIGCGLSQEDDTSTGFCSYPEAHFETTGNYDFVPGAEEFSDWNNDGNRNGRPGKFQGVRCTDNAIDQGHCADTMELRQYIGIVMSSELTPTLVDNGNGTFDLGDSNGNILPVGTTVSGSCDEGDFKELTWESPVGNAFRSDLTRYSYSTDNDGDPAAGCEVMVEIPDGPSYRFFGITDNP